MGDQHQESKKKAVETWVNSFGDKLFSWAYHKTNQQSLAEDLVQETFLAAYKSFDSFEGKSKPETWLFRILNNKIIDHYRKSGSRDINTVATDEKEIHEVTDSFFDKYGNWKDDAIAQVWAEDQNLLDDPDFNQVMGVCIDDLPPIWKSVIQLKYFQGKETQEICQELGITPSNYWQIIHRVKLLLKKCLEINWFETQ